MTELTRKYLDEIVKEQTDAVAEDERMKRERLREEKNERRKTSRRICRKI